MHLHELQWRSSLIPRALIARVEDYAFRPDMLASTNRSWRQASFNNRIMERTMSWGCKVRRRSARRRKDSSRGWVGRIWWSIRRNFRPALFLLLLGLCFVLPYFLLAFLPATIGSIVACLAVAALLFIWASRAGIHDGGLMPGLLGLSLLYTAGDLLYIVVANWSMEAASR
jgi:hypothetical protein